MTSPSPSVQGMKTVREYLVVAKPGGKRHVTMFRFATFCGRDLAFGYRDVRRYRLRANAYHAVTCERCRNLLRSPAEKAHARRPLPVRET